MTDRQDGGGPAGQRDTGRRRLLRAVIAVVALVTLVAALGGWNLLQAWAGVLLAPAVLSGHGLSGPVLSALA